MNAAIVFGTISCLTGGLILAINHSMAGGDPRSARLPQGSRAPQPEDRYAVSGMPRDELDRGLLELARGSRQLVDAKRELEQQRDVLEEALDEHRRRCCSRQDCAIRELEG